MNYELKTSNNESKQLTYWIFSLNFASFVDVQVTFTKKTILYFDFEIPANNELRSWIKVSSDRDN